MEVEIDRSQLRGRRDAPHRKHGGADGGMAAWPRRRRPPQHHAHDILGGRTRDRKGGDDASVAHDRRGIRETADLVHAVADIEHRDTRCRDLADRRTDMVDLGRRQRARRLVQDDEARRAQEGAGDLHHLPRSLTERVHHQTWVEREAQGAQRFRRLPGHRRLVQHEAAPRPGAEEHVLGDAHARNQAELLVDRAQAAPGSLACALRTRCQQRPAVEQHLAGIGCLGAGEQADQG